MRLTNNTKQYSCTGYDAPEPGTQKIFHGVEGLTLPISGKIRLVSEDDGFVHTEIDCGDYARQVYENGALTLTNEPEPAAPTAEEILAAARAAALARISGKCSAAIEAGVTVDGKHYRMKDTDQTAINAALALVGAGETSISYAADDGVMAMYTPDGIRAIARAAYKRGLVNRAYNAALYAWAGHETDTGVLDGVKYGSVLPESYAAVLSQNLTTAGIDIAELSAMLTA